MTAKEIHDSIFVLDSHCDTPILLRRKGVDIGQKLQTGHVDLVRMKEGGLDASFFAIYVSNKWEPYECTFKALEACASVYDVLDRHPDKVGWPPMQTAGIVEQVGIASSGMGEAHYKTVFLLLVTQMCVF